MSERNEAESPPNFLANSLNERSFSPRSSLICCPKVFMDVLFVSLLGLTEAVKNMIRLGLGPGLFIRGGTRGLQRNEWLLPDDLEISRWPVWVGNWSEFEPPVRVFTGCSIESRLGASLAHGAQGIRIEIWTLRHKLSHGCFRLLLNST